MNIVKITRSQEWWGYKIPPLLAIGYATTLHSGESMLATAPRLLFVMSAMVIGAAYVSVINDITDMKEDLASGKTNRMARLPPWLRGLLLGCTIAMGAGYIATLYPHVWLMTIAAMPWIAFSLYSIPPFRLKKRGIWGAFSDASGAHVFTSLFLVAGMSYYTHIPIDPVWMASVGCWALAYGLRGILWHQFTDRDNDLQVGLSTFATQTDPSSFRGPARALLALELLSLAVMLWRIGEPIPVLFLLLYLLFVIACTKRLGIAFINIMTPAGRPYHIFMGDYYQVFFPISLLLTSALVYPSGWIVLLVHVLLFSGNIVTLLRYTFRVFRTMRAFVRK